MEPCHEVAEGKLFLSPITRCILIFPAQIREGIE